MTLNGALPGTFDESQLELRPVAVTRWAARLVEPLVEQSFLDSRFNDDRRRVLVLLGFIAAAGALIVIGRYIAYLAGHGELANLLPPLVPVMTAAAGAVLIMRARSPQALEASLLAVGVVVVLIRFTIMTVQP